jgi:pSer/pThr/pTyr-binding forkhead associated (FHA) protein
MKGAVAIAHAPDTKWTIKTGPMVGVVRLINHSHFTIGRSPECEFVIVNDPKISRRHVSVRLTSKGFELVNQSEPNKVYVNGQEVTSVILSDNDVIKLGESEMQFNIMTSHRSLQSIPQSEMNVHQQQLPRRSDKRRKAPRAAGKSNGRLYIYGGVGLLVLWLIFGSDAAKKKEMALRTEQQIQADIETANKLRDAADLKNPVQADGPISQRQAQEHYVKGFRDFRKHQYERALESFQACLALQPDHILCTRYHRLAERKFDELIQYQMVLGRKYRDQNQFKPCRSAFRNVMVMVKNSTSAAYKEAKANYDACDASVEGRF